MKLGLSQLAQRRRNLIERQNLIDGLADDGFARHAVHNAAGFILRNRQPARSVQRLDPICAIIAHAG